jgi:lipopolysaccharide transport system ATP-binding protein
MKDDVILKIENVSKQYRLGLIGTGTISHDLNRFFAIIRGKEDPYLKIGETNDRSKKGKTEYVWALKEINFEVKRGEILGIIGENGAGKSTLLKILSKVTNPTTGSVKSKGRIASLLEVGTGFHPEMTGKENIFLNGAILGMTKKEINFKFDEIVAFSGCERYIDTPVKRYSSGMKVRLAFAVAAFLEPDILVVDEVLAVGDAEFQKKAIGKMQDISNTDGRTVLFVSHNMAAVKNLCTQGVLLEMGEIKCIGNIITVLEEYQRSTGSSSDYYIESSNKEHYTKSAKIINGQRSFYSDELIKFELIIESGDNDIKSKFLLIRVLGELEQVLFSCQKELIKDKKNYLFTIPKGTLVKGNYNLNIIIYEPAIAQFDNINTCCSFTILNNIEEYAHLETFDIGSMYVSKNWLK